MKTQMRTPILLLLSLILLTSIAFGDTANPTISSLQGVLTIGVFGVLVGLALVMLIIAIIIDGIKNFMSDKGKGYSASLIFYIPASLMFLVVGYISIMSGISVPVGTSTETINETIVETTLYSPAPVFSYNVGLMFVIFAIMILSRSYYVFKGSNDDKEDYGDNRNKRNLYRFP